MKSQFCLIPDLGLLAVVTVKMYHQFYPRVRVEVRFQQRIRLRGEVGGGEGRNPLGAANHLSREDQGQHQHNSRTGEEPVDVAGLVTQESI